MELRFLLIPRCAGRASVFCSCAVAAVVIAWMFLPALALADLSDADHSHAASLHRLPIERPIEKIQYSEFNHHVSGAGLLVIGLMALGMELGRSLRPDLQAVRWLWPAGWVLLGSFLFIRSDPDNWPWGAIGLVETLSDPETLQHKVFSAVIMVIGIIEGVQIAGRPNGQGWRLAFPLLAIGSGTLLGLHSFVHVQMPHVYWQHLAFALVGILVGVSKLLRDRGVLDRGYRPFIWPMLLIVFGVQLMLYTEH